MTLYRSGRSAAVALLALAFTHVALASRAALKRDEDAFAVHAATHRLQATQGRQCQNSGGGIASDSLEVEGVSLLQSAKTTRKATVPDTSDEEASEVRSTPRKFSSVLQLSVLLREGEGVFGLVIAVLVLAAIMFGVGLCLWTYVDDALMERNDRARQSVTLSQDELLVAGRKMSKLSWNLPPKERSGSVSSRSSSAVHSQTQMFVPSPGLGAPAFAQPVFSKERTFSSMPSALPPTSGVSSKEQMISAGVFAPAPSPAPTASAPEATPPPALVAKPPPALAPKLPPPPPSHFCADLVVPDACDCTLLVPILDIRGGPLEVVDVTGSLVLRATPDARPTQGPGEPGDLKQIVLTSAHGKATALQNFKSRNVSECQPLADAAGSDVIGEAPAKVAKMVLATCRRELSEKLPQQRKFELLQADGTIFGTLSRSQESSCQHFMLTTVAGTRYHFTGAFERQSAVMTSESGDVLASTERYTAPFDASGEYYRLKAEPLTDIGLILCSLMSITYLDERPASERTAQFH